MLCDATAAIGMVQRAGIGRTRHIHVRMIWVQQKAWQEAYPDKVKAYHRKYAAKDDVKERKREFERANRERINTRRRELYRLRNPLPTPTEGNDSADQPTHPTDE